jgi:hypothetical protein
VEGLENLDEKAVFTVQNGRLTFKVGICVFENP